jgi:hypothetical protein
MPLHTFLHSLLNVLVETANKMGLEKSFKPENILSSLTNDYNKSKGAICLSSENKN